MIRKLLLCAVLGFAAPSLSLATGYTFTIRGIISASDLSGYNVDEVITVSFTTLETTAPVSANSSSSYQWEEDGTASTLLAAISGSGFTGSYAHAADSLNVIALFSNGSNPSDLNLFGISYGIGLGVYAGGELLTDISIQGMLPDISFVYGLEDVTIDYFAPYVGTHIFERYPGESTPSSLTTFNGSLVKFHVTELTITPVPEPSAAFIVLGGAAGYAFLRRRRGARS